MTHVIVHARPEGPLPVRQHSIDGRSLECVHVVGPLTSRFSFTYETLEQRLAALPRMFCEPDGSFVWRCESGGQVDGLISDDGEQVVALELNLQAGPNVLDTLLRTLGWPQQSVLFQCVLWGCYLEEPQFRDHFCGAS